MILFAKWLVAALSFILIAELFDGVSISGTYIALIVALFWGVLSVTVRPILILLTLPINILTLGLFTFVINALLILLLASFIDGFDVDGFWWGLAAAFGVAVLSWAGNILIQKIAKNTV